MDHFKIKISILMKKKLNTRLGPLIQIVIKKHTLMNTLSKMFHSPFHRIRWGPRSDTVAEDPDPLGAAGPRLKLPQPADGGGECQQEHQEMRNGASPWQPMDH